MLSHSPELTPDPDHILPVTSHTCGHALTQTCSAPLPRQRLLNRCDGCLALARARQMFHASALSLPVCSDGSVCCLPLCRSSSWHTAGTAMHSNIFGTADCITAASLDARLLSSRCASSVCLVSYTVVPSCNIFGTKSYPKGQKKVPSRLLQPHAPSQCCRSRTMRARCC